MTSVFEPADVIPSTDLETVTAGWDAVTESIQAEVARPDFNATETCDVIGVVGLGYVGLPTALALAESGTCVIGCDVSGDRIEAIETGAVDLLDSDHRRLRHHVGSDRFLLRTDPVALSDADVVVVCVPTPVDEHQVPDLAALTAACRTVAEHAVAGQTFILTSTTYVGCTRDLLVAPLAARGFEVGKDVFVAFSPERIDPGNAVHPHDDTPRVVGGITEACRRRAGRALRRTAPVVHEVSSPEAAELTKLLENGFRAVNIALANEFADVAHELGLDVVEVIDAAATKPYGFMPFYPGPGVGGHCIPCDPHYLLWQLKARRVQSPVVETAMSAVAARPGRVVARAREVLAEDGRPLTGARVLIVGVAYKPDVADVRESPALAIIADLLRSGAEVAYTDPYVESVQVGGRDIPAADPHAFPWDLVLVHTVHRDVEYGWMAEFPRVLDATYKVADVPHRNSL